MLRLFHYLILFDEIQNLIPGPHRIFIRVEVKSSEKLILKLLWRPPRIRRLLQLVLHTKEYLLGNLEYALLSSQLQRNVQVHGVSYNKHVT